MKATYKLFLRKDYENLSTENPVYLRLTINRKSRYYSTGIFIKEESLKNGDKIRVKPTVNDSTIINLKLADIENQVLSIVNNFERFSLPPTFTDFEHQFKGKYSKDSFYEYASNFINTKPELSDETKRTYRSQLTKLEKFIKKQNQTFQEINNLIFIESYKAYMITSLKNKLNTYTKSLSFIRTIIRDAKKHSAINYNVFEKITLKKEPGKRHFLTYEEMVKIEEYYYSENINAKHKKVLRYFLFSCYTGLRYRDLKALRYKHIVSYSIKKNKKTEERKLVQLYMHKTKREVSIPLVKQSLKYLEQEMADQEYFVFKVLSNQKTNTYIKEALKKAGIVNSEKISCHSARHTFASHAIRHGMPMKIVSSILGHTEVKTTEIYAHMIKDAIFEGMDKIYSGK